MIAVRNTLFFVASTALFFERADGASMTDLTTRCLPDDPTVCVGITGMSTPSPAVIDGVVQYMGGYSWSYTFVEGLEEGTFNDWATVNEHKTGLTVQVSIDSDKTTCEVEVNGEMCNWCSTEGCDVNDSDIPQSIQYDCTNVKDGKASTDECEEYKPILYPFEPKKVCTSYIWGDPHLVTFDGVRFDAQPKGEAIFLMDEASPFGIHGRLTQALAKYSLPAVTTGVAIHGKDVNQPTIQLFVTTGDDATAVIDTPNGFSCPIGLYVDCTMQDSMSYQSSDLIVESEGSEITVVYPGLLSVTFKVRMYGTCHFSMEVNLLDCEAAKDTVRGLLGSPNGDASDDWMDRDGNAITIPQGASAYFFEPAFDYTKLNWMVTDVNDSIFCPDEDFEEPDEEYDDEIEELIEDPDECCIEICGDDIGCLVECVTLGCDAAEEFMKEQPPGTNNDNEQTDDDLVCGE